MISDVLPELANSSAQTMRRVLAAPEPGDPPALFVKGFLRESRLVLNFISGYRDYLSALLADIGIEGTSFKNACETMADTLDNFLQRVAALRAIVEQQSRPTDGAAPMEELKQLESQATNARRSFAEWLEVLNRPQPEIDWNALEEESRAARKAGAYVRYETPEDILRDLGGDL